MSDQLQSQVQPPPTLIPLRPARALIGWMNQQEAALWLAGRRTDLQGNPEYVQRAEAARHAVAARPAGIDQAGLLDTQVEQLAPHIASLSAHPASLQFLQEGWRVVIADLSKVCAVQPSIFTDQTSERVMAVDRSNVLSLVRFTLPIPSPAPIPFQFDTARNAYVLSSRNPNLRIAGQFQSQVEPGVSALGFLVAETPSYMQVAFYGGRYLLRDGYHRAYGLLASGITRVPVFYREFSTSGELALPSGLFSHDVFLGERPPTLVDYLDEEVSAPIEMPATSKVVVIQGLELNALA